jgi:hypothetical protein
MKTKIDNQNSEKEQKNILDSSIGLTITNLYLHCKNCNHTFYRTVIGIIRRKSGRLVVSSKERPDRPFKIGKCLKCGSKEIYHIEYL